MGRYICKISMTMLGPILSAAAGGGAYGLDKAFSRDWQGHLAIPASHIKGKLRMALDELKAHFPPNRMVPTLDEWFGVGGDDSDFSYAPARGELTFSDLTCEMQAVDEQRARVRIHPETGTALDKHLRELEDAFPSGHQVVWSGAVTFYAKDDAAAQAIADTLRVGLRWLTTLGGEKGSGYGRILTTKVSKAELEIVTEPPQLSDSDALHLRITPLEPVLVGDSKNRRTNFIESKHEFAGGVIKGALATCLNQAYGIEPVYRAIDGAYAQDFAGLAALVQHFAQIRITHALPTYRGKPRPMRRPLSTVQQEDEYWDTALADEAFPLTKGQAPSYFVDWKGGESYFGAAVPVMIYETRVGIDDLTQRAQEGQLFTYAFCCPCDEDESDIEWVCNVSFAGVPEAERMAVKQQFAAAVQQHLRHLGKLGRAIQVTVGDDEAPRATSLRSLIEDEMALVTLQSDAIMLAAEQVGQLGIGRDLGELYGAFWAEVSGENGVAPCLELMDFYAHQDFRGGYLYHRYLGASERAAGNSRYRPYYLTRAGSVFKLRVRDRTQAEPLLARWCKQGLPLPGWAKAVYGQQGQALWANCPFVPENGYGEIAVNLAWHWDKQI